MPTWMRRYCIQQANEFYTEEKRKHDDAMEKAKAQSKNYTKGRSTARPPNFFSGGKAK